MAHYPLKVLPDPTLAVITYLSSLSEVTSLVAADHILTKIPVSPTYPYILVQQAGGKGNWPGIDEVAIQIDVIGGIQELCNLITRTVRTAIWSIANDVITVTSNNVTSTAILVEGKDESGPSWMPDMEPVPPLSRYTARYAITLH